MTCKDFIELLGDYLETTVSAETLATLEEHLADCAPCQAYLRTYRRASDLAAAAQREEVPPAMPPEMKARLRAFLLAQLVKDES